jgi:4-hydroxy-tetrahydrodipicolinate reductase
MRFGIVGAGKMGGEIEAMAGRRGHEVVWKLDSGSNARGEGLTSERLSKADVVFEFTNPGAAPGNLEALGRAGATVVCGTTGWDRDLPRIVECFRDGEGALVHSANFSVGVRLFFEVARLAARLYPAAGYAAFLVEEHHAEKKDAPSGTARKLAQVVEEASGEKPPISSVRGIDPGHTPTGVRISRG